MGFKDKMNENPMLAVGFAGGLIVLAAIVIYFSQAGGPGTSSKAYFTVDDGATYFADDVKKLPPFDHDGKQAVRAYVFEAKGQKYVSYLERYLPDAKKMLEQAPTSGGDPRAKPVQAGGLTEVKRPGGTEWVPSADHAKSGPITSYRPAGVSYDDITPVEP